jgi:raffinose/stachyose/melibiose transport system substrate-binding protein
MPRICGVCWLSRTPAIGLSRAVAAGRFGYADWTYLPPRTEHLVTTQVRPLAEGTLEPADHLAQVHAVFTDEMATAPVPGLI